MARKKFGELTERSRDKIYAKGARYGLTSRQARERYNRGTWNPLSRNPQKAIPQRASYYPIETGRELKDAAMANWDKQIDWLDPFTESNRMTVADAIEHHATDTALRRMAGASRDEIKTWARYQRAYGKKGSRTPEWLRSMGWYDENGKWHNPFWYH